MTGKSLDEILTKLVAKDGISVNTVCNSYLYGSCCPREEVKLPIGGQNVMNLVHKFYQIAKDKTIDEISKLKENIFSLTLDEWTSDKKSTIRCQA